ncbi:MAG: ATP-binding protein [Lachnospiraceae bacterium]|nr:ATP-binding protein [Lachnospiraceae bacterium]
MLLEFSCSNHKSIREKVLFSALAGSDTQYVEKTKEFEGYNVLKSAVIYGANGSGKSNFIDAISFVKKLVIKSINYQPGQGIRQIPHKLDGYDTESVYRIQFVTGDIRYLFGFSLKNMLITEEYLYYFPNGRQVKIYEREQEDFQTGNRFKGKLSTCKDVLKPNRLLLSCAANFSSVKEIEQAYRFFNDELVIYGSENQENWLQYSLYQMNTNEKLKETVVLFMQSLGTDIKGLDVTIKQKKVEDVELPDFLSDEFKKKILQGSIESINAKVIYETFETDLLQEESTGIKKLFGLLCPLLDIIINGKVLICDELEAGLHESLVFGLVKLFVEMETQKFPQIFFTTHETGLLNLDLFRRDQIWFTEMKGMERSTDLYSLAEIKNVRKDDNFGKGYISGKYGAIPMLNIDFANIVSRM